MIITIDTSKDSHEDIRKAIVLLQQVVGDSQASSPVQSNPMVGSVAAEGFASMFGDVSAMVQPDTSNAAPSSPAPIVPEQPQIIGLPAASPKPVPKAKVEYDFETY